MELEMSRILVVVGYNSPSVQEALKGYPVEFVHQEQQLGTGHAVLTAMPRLADAGGSTLVLYGDSPLITTKTLGDLLHTREREEADEIFLICRYENPFGYGRVIRNDENQVVDVVEEADVTPEQRLIKEVNTGFYCFDTGSLRHVLTQLSNNTAQGEYYLTDTVRLLTQSGKKVITAETSDPGETRGVNDPRQLAELEAELQGKA
jgi:bifunctional UDP-N-acetylglucosamine pyrophosphorylase/glucosamine-1-phosphate N-acetyltransferase